MVEILDLIIEFFRVQNFASNYSNPLDQFLYAIFFPSILLIILIYLLVKRIFPEHGGISALLGVSFYIFLIVYPPNATSSLYGAFAPIGTVWYIVVILIGLLYVLLHRILPTKKDGGGGGGKSFQAVGDLLESGEKARRAYREVSGGEEKRLLAQADEFIATKRRLEKELGRSRTAEESARVNEHLIRNNELSINFFNKLVNHPLFGNKIKKKEEQFNRA